MSESKKRGIAVVGSWVPFPRAFLQSRACAELSPHGAKLLIDVLALLGPNGAGNGDLSLSPKSMAIRGWPGRSTLSAATKELLEYGLLFKTRQGGRLDCSLFALTLFPLDCELSKIEARPGCYYQTAYQGTAAALADPPKETAPAKWRHARMLKPKGDSVAPPRDKVSKMRPATGQTQKPRPRK